MVDGMPAAHVRLWAVTTKPSYEDYSFYQP
jgi:hypothetical protein